jgi:asparagine synthetase B (glutamine-hydrolysing)
MSKIVDKEYCMSSFLTFRYVVDENKIFAENVVHDEYKLDIAAGCGGGYICDSAEEIDAAISEQFEKLDLSNAGLLLSGGIDSAILASYMPKGMKAYTAICSAQGAIDETPRAKRYCDINGLEHVVVDIKWEDYENSIDELMLHDGSPLYANEPQVYKLAQRMKADGVKTVIFGENADTAFGGMDRLLSKDWKYDEWKKRYTFVEPSQVLKKFVDMDEVYRKYKVGKDDVDYIKFIDEIFGTSSSGAYTNAFKLAGLDWFSPYARLKMGKPLDLKRVRSGDSKYLLRDLFRKKYPELDVPEKIAMPRAADQWMADWKGPVRKEFIPGCADGMTGEQKFMIYSLERFLNLI